MFNKLFFIFKQNYSINSKLLKVLKNMPKEQKHIAEAQKQRLKIKEKSSKYSPAKVTLQVLGTGAKGAPRCLYIFSDQSRYLFNCGEGTQRLAHEHKMKLAKLEHVFVTQPTWKNMGGLPGAALTIQDVGVPQIVLHGPRGLEEIFVATHRFVVIKDLKIRVAQCDETTSFEDNVMKVSYVPLTKTNIAADDITESNENEIVEADIDYYGYANSGRKQEQQKISESSKLELQQNKKHGVSMAYICRLQPRPGALCLDACVKAGVPPGPLLGKLKSGEDITLPNGNLVKAKDVCEPDDPGPVFIVLECPTIDYLDSLLENEQFKKHQTSASCDEDLATLVVHFTPQNVIDHPKYKEWMNRFNFTCQHLIINESNSCMGSLSVHRIQYKLNLLSEKIFPLLGDNGTNIINEPSNKKIKPNENHSLSIENLSVNSEVNEFQALVHPRTLCSYQLRPKKGLDCDGELNLYPAEFVEETFTIESFDKTLKEMKENFPNQQNLGESFPRVLFLGTGSSIPNKTRNTSGILLEISDDCSVLMDCGEGTYGQLIRFYGQTNSDEILTKIKAVYISHLHADHHLGLIGLLLGRRQSFLNLGKQPKPLYLFAPRQIMWWLNFYDNCFEDIACDFELIPNQNFLIGNSNQLIENDKLTEILTNLSLSKIETCYVKHCPNSFGVSFTDINNKKITYSGDTMPAENLVKLGMDSDLLIHEATMEDELADEAVIKMHSTTSQAIEIGRLMNAKYTLLTHFSQRYAKLPRINENFTENVGIAFDNMMVSLDDLKVLHHFYPVLKLMFVEHYEELEVKAAKRMLRLERQKEIVEKNKV